MLERDLALDILGSSVLDFMERTGGLTKENLKTEIRNNITLYFLINRRIKASSQTTISEMLQSVISDAENTNTIIKVFTNAAKELFFENYDDRDALITLLDVNEQLGEKNVWAYLKDYFMKYHKQYIGD